MFQAEMQKEQVKQKRFQRISFLAVNGTIAACILIVTGIYRTRGYLPEIDINHLMRIDISIVIILIALWGISKFQLQMLFKQKLQ
jgi:hypothetical protein